MLTNVGARVTGSTASRADGGRGFEGPLGVPAFTDNAESNVFQVREPTISAPSAHVADPAKVENP